MEEFKQAVSRKENFEHIEFSKAIPLFGVSNLRAFRCKKNWRRFNCKYFCKWGIVEFDGCDRTRSYGDNLEYRGKSVLLASFGIFGPSQFQTKSLSLL